MVRFVRVVVVLAHFVSHDQLDVRHADGLVVGIYFETPHRTHYRCIRVRRVFIRPFLSGRLVCL